MIILSKSAQMFPICSELCQSFLKLFFRNISTKYCSKFLQKFNLFCGSFWKKMCTKSENSLNIVIFQIMLNVLLLAIFWNKISTIMTPCTLEVVKLGRSSFSFQKSLITNPQCWYMHLFCVYLFIYIFMFKIPRYRSQFYTNFYETDGLMRVSSRANSIVFGKNPLPPNRTTDRVDYPGRGEGIKVIPKMVSHLHFRKH